MAPDRVIAAQIWEVLEVEGPLHESDLFSRVAEYWDALRVGNRIESRLRQVLTGLATSGRVAREGEFAHIPGRSVRPRSRTGTRIPAERIAPAEYRAAVLAVLGTGPRPREELLADARRLLGFDRTGTGLKERLSTAVEALVLEGLVGQGSAGYALRDGRPAPA